MCATAGAQHTSDCLHVVGARLSALDCLRTTACARLPARILLPQYELHGQLPNKKALQWALG